MVARSKVSSKEDLERLFKTMKKAQILSFLKGHHLLKACSVSRRDQQPKLGDLVWARYNSAVYWPAFLAEMEDAPGVEPEKEPSRFTYVMFLEDHFRYFPVHWGDVIPMQDIDIDIQKLLVQKLNKLQYKTKPQPGKKQWKLLDEFLPIPASKRQREAELKFEILVLQKKKESSQKYEQEKKGLLSTNEEPSSNHNLKDDVKVKINQVVSETKKRKKSGLRVSDRIVTKQVVQLKTKITTAKKKTDEPVSGKQPPKSKPINKNTRPDGGGALLKEYVKTRFDQINKAYTFESSNTPPPCGSCDKLIENIEDVKYCHGLPHHNECLSECSIDKKDSSSEVSVRKCKLCIDQCCFICKHPSDEKDTVYKCSRCDLRFHISCLQKDWPQAEIQGSNGPITCPVHFCHTCLGEQKTNGKFRDFTTIPSKSYHCLYCLSTYHKHCLPAGCGEDIRGKEYIVCPKHKLPDLKVTQRRIGCLICFKCLKGKNHERVECQFCVQAFHPECIGYTSEIREKVGLADFAKGYKCFTCKWGLFPLYGQVVWFQQPCSQYWPARILYPAEHKLRSALGNTKRKPGEYSVEYCGHTSFYDNASRAVPLHLATVGIFETMRVYQHTPKILRAHEEASYFLLFGEDNRDKNLPTPKPVYKKIERNVYRTTMVTKTKEPTDVCSCSEDSNSEYVCLPDSGCTNRDMEMECSDRICKGGKRCSNRMFVERKNDDDYLQQKLFPNKGWGVIAKKSFEPGDFVAEYRGEVIDRNEMQKRLGKKDEEDPMYILEISKEFFIDAEYIGNLSRLINHSCDPNCEIRKYLSLGRSVGGIFAKRKIEVEEEVTFDYGCGSQSTTAFRCHCGSKKCIVFVGKEVPDDFRAEEDGDQHIDNWDDVCAHCGYGGKVICCDFVGCGKVWHYPCANLTRAPPTKWYCPDHPSRVLPPPVKKKSTGNSKLSKRKVSKARASRRVSSTGSTSQITPKRKTSSKSVPASEAVTLDAKSLSKSHVDEIETNQKTQKRKLSEQNEQQMSQKKLKTSAASKKSENLSEALSSNKISMEKLPAAPYKTERVLRSSIPKIILSQKQNGLIKGDVQNTDSEDISLNPSSESIMTEPVAFVPANFTKAKETVEHQPTRRSASLGILPVNSPTTRSTRKRRTESCNLKDNTYAINGEDPLNQDRSNESVCSDDVALSNQTNNYEMNSPNGSKRRSKLRAHLSTRSENFSPLKNSNVQMNGCILEHVSNGDIPADEKLSLGRNGMVTRSTTTGSFSESQPFVQIDTPAIIQNGTPATDVVSLQEVKYEPPDNDAVSTTSSPGKVELEYCEAENEEADEVDIMYANQPRTVNRRRSRQYSTDK